MTDYDTMSLDEIFRLDVKERVRVLNNHLIRLEKEPESNSLIEEAMREAHSLKAAARIVNQDDAQILAHTMEDLFDGASQSRICLSPDKIDVLLAAADAIDAIAEAFVLKTTHTIDVQALIAQLQAATLSSEASLTAGDGEIVESKPNIPLVEESLPEQKNGTTENSVRFVNTSVPVEEPSVATVRVNIERLNALMNLSGEIYTNSLQLDRQYAVEKGVHDIIALLEDQIKKATETTIEQTVGTESNNIFLSQALATVASLRDAVTLNSGVMEKLTTRFSQLGKELQDSVMRSRMMPIVTVFDPQRRFLRDRERETSKKIRLEIQGGDTEVDKTVLELLKDPIAHLVRNACDHGIESPNERIELGKKEEGVLLLAASHKADRVVVVVEDDGRGINFDAVRKHAVSKELLTQADVANCTTEQILELLFLPGFSTANEVTAISGRGIGLDVVRNVLSKVGGKIHIETQPGMFTRFILSLPLTLAVHESLLVECGGEVFCFPLTGVQEVASSSNVEFRLIKGQKVVELQGEIIPCMHLADIWGLEKQSSSRNTSAPLIVIGEGVKKIGLIVDRLLSQTGIVSKPLDSRLGTVADIAGTAVLSDGQPAFVVEIDSLVRSCNEQKSTPIAVDKDTAEKFARKQILVVEDSLTVRELERKTLENHGYRVVTAVDGLDGYNKAKLQKFDLVVTDIEMPRMDGFELLSRMKQESKLSEIPTIIVSYRESENDKRRGLELGADCYLTKSKYGNESLLAAVGRLIGV